jgi:hypothetical protein
MPFNWDTGQDVQGTQSSSSKSSSPSFVSPASGPASYDRGTGDNSTFNSPTMITRANGSVEYYAPKSSGGGAITKEQYGMQTQAVQESKQSQRVGNAIGDYRSGKTSYADTVTNIQTINKTGITSGNIQMAVGPGTEGMVPASTLGVSKYTPATTLEDKRITLINPSDISFDDTTNVMTGNIPQGKGFADKVRAGEDRILLDPNGGYAKINPITQQSEWVKETKVVSANDLGFGGLNNAAIESRGYKIAPLSNLSYGKTSEGEDIVNYNPTMSLGNSINTSNTNYGGQTGASGIAGIQPYSKANAQSLGTNSPGYVSGGGVDNSLRSTNINSGGVSYSNPAISSGIPGGNGASVLQAQPQRFQIDYGATVPGVTSYAAIVDTKTQQSLPFNKAYSSYALDTVKTNALFTPAATAFSTSKGMELNMATQYTNFDPNKSVIETGRAVWESKSPLEKAFIFTEKSTLSGFGTATAANTIGSVADNIFYGGRNTKENVFYQKQNLLYSELGTGEIGRQQAIANKDSFYPYTRSFTEVSQSPVGIFVGGKIMGNLFTGAGQTASLIDSGLASSGGRVASKFGNLAPASTAFQIGGAVVGASYVSGEYNKFVSGDTTEKAAVVFTNTLGVAGGIEGSKNPFYKFEGGNAPKTVFTKTWDARPVIRTLDIPQQAMGQTKEGTYRTVLLGSENIDKGTSKVWVSLTPEGLQRGAPYVTEPLKNMPLTSEIKVGSALEATTLQKSFKALGTEPQARLAGGSTIRTQELIPTSQMMMSKTLNTQSKFIDESLLTAPTARMGSKGVGVILDTAMEYKGQLAGSGSRRFQMNPDMTASYGEPMKISKVPNDLDVHIDYMSEEAIGKNVLPGVFTKLKSIGSETFDVNGEMKTVDYRTVRATADKPNAFEAKVNGKYEKLTEFLGKDSNLGGEAVPEYVAGIPKVGSPLNTKMGLSTTRLNEELRGVTQGVLRVKMTNVGGKRTLDIFPPEKRMKDIGSVSLTARNLEMSGAKIGPEIARFESMYPKELVRSQVESALSTKEILADFSLKPSKASLGRGSLSAMSGYGYKSMAYRSVKGVNSEFSGGLSRSLSKSASPFSPGSYSPSMSSRSMSLGSRSASPSTSPLSRSFSSGSYSSRSFSASVSSGSFSSSPYTSPSPQSVSPYTSPYTPPPPYIPPPSTSFPPSAGWSGLSGGMGMGTKSVSDKEWRRQFRSVTTLL